MLSEDKTNCKKAIAQWCADSRLGENPVTLELLWKTLELLAEGRIMTFNQLQWHMRFQRADIIAQPFYRAVLRLGSEITYGNFALDYGIATPRSAGSNDKIARASTLVAHLVQEDDLKKISFDLPSHSYETIMHAYDLEKKMQPGGEYPFSVFISQLVVRGCLAVLEDLKG